MQEKTLDQELEEIALNEAMAKIKRKIMVMSNKGGVGKSTVSANIADELANQGYRTGLLDIDIHGPSQAKIFKDTINISGIALTKLDGTAKGGVIVAISDILQIPIRYIGVGEKIDDLREFVAKDFVEALFED